MRNLCGKRRDQKIQSPEERHPRNMPPRWGSCGDGVGCFKDSAPLELFPDKHEPDAKTISSRATAREIRLWVGNLFCFRCGFPEFHISLLARNKRFSTPVEAGNKVGLMKKFMPHEAVEEQGRTSFTP